MGVEDDHDYSYYRHTRVPTPRRTRKPEPREPHPLAAFGVGRVRRDAPVIEDKDFKSAIKRLLAHEPDLTVDQIFERLRFSVRVSRNTVSGIRTEFRHSMRVLREMGMLKR